MNGDGGKDTGPVVPVCPPDDAPPEEWSIYLDLLDEYDYRKTHPQKDGR